MLERLERNPHAVFTQLELASRFPEEFQRAKDGRQVRRVTAPPSPGESGAYVHPSGRTYVVVPVPGGWEAFDDEDPEEDPIRVSSEDLVRWTLGLEALAQRIQKASGLHGRPGSLDDHQFFLGEKLFEDTRVAVVLGLFSNEDIALRSMRSLSNLMRDSYGYFVVVCPSYNPTPEVDRELDSLDIEVIQMRPDDPFVLDLKTGPRRAKVRGPRIVLAEGDEKEFQQQGFNYRLPIHVTAREAGHNSTVLLVDGNEISLPLAPFKLFMWILGGLFHDPSGFISWDELKNFTEDLWERSRTGEGSHEAIYNDPVPAATKVRYVVTGAVAAALLIAAVNLLTPVEPELPVT
ncbi:MAG: hypothetical protein ACE5Q6_17340, partial [Dehalococcoidia bacterium]